MTDRDELRLWLAEITLATVFLFVGWRSQAIALYLFAAVGVIMIAWRRTR